MFVNAYIVGQTYPLGFCLETREILAIAAKHLDSVPPITFFKVHDKNNPNNAALAYEAVARASSLASREMMRAFAKEEKFSRSKQSKLLRAHRSTLRAAIVAGMVKNGLPVYQSRFKDIIFRGLRHLADVEVAEEFQRMFGVYDSDSQGEISGNGADIVKIELEALAHRLDPREGRRSILKGRSFEWALQILDGIHEAKLQTILSPKQFEKCFSYRDTLNQSFQSIIRGKLNEHASRN